MVTKASGGDGRTDALCVERFFVQALGASEDLIGVD